MNKRKLVLSVIDVVLAIILVCQVAFRSKEKVQTYTINNEITKIEVNTQTEDIILTKHNANWLVNGVYPADVGLVESMIEELESIRVIDQMAKSDDENVLSKYDLQKGKAIEVRVYCEDKLVRTLAVGKNTASLYQTYLKIDNEKGVYLVAGDFQEDFLTSIDKMRSNVVWAIDSFDINEITQTNANGRFTCTYADETWAISGTDLNLSSSDVETWVNGFGTITANHWLPDDAELPGTEEFRIDLTTTDGKKLWLVINSAFDAASGMDLYYGEASECPYPFEISSYFVNKLQKK